MVEDRSGKVSKSTPVGSFLRDEEKIKDVGFEGDEGRRGEVGEVKGGVAIAVR